jgi:hypothetical protein
MALSKLELALVLVIAAGLLAIERGHRIDIGTPAAAQAGPPAGSVCPSTDDVPIGAACMKFIGSGLSRDIRPGAAASGPPAALDRGDQRIDLSAPPCPPSNETAPYSARCLGFLSGWFWRANSQISD